MMLDWQGRVAECTGANIFFVKDGKIHTPMADCFLDGITRRDGDRARQEARLEVIERRIMPEELTNLANASSGTAAEVTAVSEIAQWKFKPGAITEQLMDDYAAEIQPQGRGRGGVVELHAFPFVTSRRPYVPRRVDRRHKAGHDFQVSLALRSARNERPSEAVRRRARTFALAVFGVEPQKSLVGIGALDRGAAAPTREAGPRPR